jgi:hypothetical protein
VLITESDVLSIHQVISHYSPLLRIDRHSRTASVTDRVMGDDDENNYGAIPAQARLVGDRISSTTTPAARQIAIACGAT